MREYMTETEEGEERLDEQRKGSSVIREACLYRLSGESELN